MKEIDDILDSGILSGFKGFPAGHLGGEHVQKLEAEFCKYFNIKYAVAMSSATACLHASLIACGVEGEVIVSPYTFSSSASCVLMVGAKPVFADIDEDTFCITPKEIKKNTTGQTQVIIPVHLMGHPADMDEIMKIAQHYHLRVIEDAAQSIGAKYKGQKVGTIGDCGIFSFNQSKHINTGEGGMLITNDDYIARVARAVRNHGEVSDPELKICGYNYRMCEIEAAIALPQFKKLDRMNSYRNALANYMTKRLSDIPEFIPPIVKEGCKHVYYTYAVKYKGTLLTRDEFQDEMLKRGVYFGKGYVKPLYLLPIYGYEEGLCPVAERMWRELMVFDWLKYPTTFEDIDRAVQIAKEVLNGQTSEN